MKSFMTFLATFLLTFLAGAADPAVPDLLQAVSVTIKTDHGSGSGIVIARKNDKGETVNFVWTAAHVISDLRREREVILSGSKKTVVEFGTPDIFSQLVEDGETVGQSTLQAQVIKYSPPEVGEDLALLRIIRKNAVMAGARFYSEVKPPALGTDIYHCGSMGGSFASNSLTSGIYSFTGRMIEQKTFDQVSAGAWFGSSGCGIFLKADGRCVGMVQQKGKSDSLILIKPARVIRKWAEENKVLWAFDEKEKMPTDAELKKLSLE